MPQPADSIERDLRLGDQFMRALLDAGIKPHVRRAGQGVFDGPAGDLAGGDHVIGSGRVVRFRVADHVYDMWFQRHLKISGRGQMPPRRLGIKRVAQEAHRVWR